MRTEHEELELELNRQNHQVAKLLANTPIPQNHLPTPEAVVDEMLRQRARKEMTDGEFCFTHCFHCNSGNLPDAKSHDSLCAVWRDAE